MTYLQPKDGGFLPYEGDTAYRRPNSFSMSSSFSST